MTIPVLLKITVSLASILVVNRLVKNLAISIATGALIIAFWSGQNITSIASISLNRLAKLG